RDLYVTGVQTCALPISGFERHRAPIWELHGQVEPLADVEGAGPAGDERVPAPVSVQVGERLPDVLGRGGHGEVSGEDLAHLSARSEERRVGKECRCRGA